MIPKVNDPKVSYTRDTCIWYTMTMHLFSMNFWKYITSYWNMQILATELYKAVNGWYSKLVSDCFKLNNRLCVTLETAAFSFFSKFFLPYFYLIPYLAYHLDLTSVITSFSLFSCLIPTLLPFFFCFLIISQVSYM